MSLKVLKTSNIASGRFMGPAVFFLSFIVYLVTLAPEVTFWDSGDLTFGAVTLGLPHPPAYPVFCMLGKAFSLLPLGNAAYRINLMSAFFAAAAVYLLYRLVLELGAGSPGARLIAASVSLGFAFYRHFWSQAVVTKELVINAFLLMVVSTMLYYYHKGRGVAFLHASAFLMGLAVVSHQSTLFILPVYFLYFILTENNYRKPAVIAVSLFFFLLAYSVVIYLPIRAMTNPAHNIGDPRTLRDFFWVMKWDTYADTLTAISGNVYNHLTAAWIAAAAFAAALCASLIYLFRRKGFILFMAFSALFSFVSITALTLGAEGIEKQGLKGKFFIPAVILAVPVLAEIFFLAWNKRPKSGTVRVVVTVIAALILVALPVWGLTSNWKDNDNSRDFFAYDFATNTLKSVKQDAALFARGDNGIFPVWYLTGFERYRDDVLFMHSELLTYHWYMSDIQKRVYEKYGITFVPGAMLFELDKNVAGMRASLEERTPTYFDYSAASFLKVPIETMRPQGLVHMLPSREAVPLQRLWDRYVLRGAFDDSTNKAFAAEGILDIYAYEVTIWVQQAYKEGRTVEALEAYELSNYFGMSDEFMEKWAQDVRKSLKKEQK